MRDTRAQDKSDMQRGLRRTRRTLLGALSGALSGALLGVLTALLVVAALWAALAARPLHAQSVDPTWTPAEEPAAAGAAAATAGTPVGPDDVNAVARQLWCPLCSGVRLDACELKACAQMKDEIGIMLAQGEEVQQIKDTFVTRYGPQVLGEPPRTGWSWLAWALPFIVLAAGGVFLYTRARRMAPAPAAAASAPPPAGEYDRKLDDELKEYK